MISSQSDSNSITSAASSPSGSCFDIANPESVPPTSALKPALKKRCHLKHPKDYISKINTTQLYSLRRTHSDTTLTSPHYFPSYKEQAAISPSTPKDMVLGFFGDSLDLCQSPTSLEPPTRHIRFRPSVDERLFELDEIIYDPTAPQMYTIASSMEESFRSLQAIVNAEYEEKRRKAEAKQAKDNINNSLNSLNDSEQDTLNLENREESGVEVQNANPEESYEVQMESLSNIEPSIEPLIEPLIEPSISNETKSAEDKQVSRSYGSRDSTFLQLNSGDVSNILDQVDDHTAASFDFNTPDIKTLPGSILKEGVVQSVLSVASILVSAVSFTSSWW